MYDQLKYVNAFEEVVFELIYRRERHNNGCAVFTAETTFEKVYNTFGEQREITFRREVINQKLEALYQKAVKKA